MIERKKEMVSRDHGLNHNTSSNDENLLLWNLSDIKPITTLSFPLSDPVMLDSRKTKLKYLNAQQCAIYLLDSKYYRVITTTNYGQIITMTLDEYILSSDDNFINSVASWLGIKNLCYKKHNSDLNDEININNIDFCTLLWLLSNNTIYNSSSDIWLESMGFSTINHLGGAPTSINININENLLLKLMRPKYFGYTSRPYLWLAFLTGIMIIKSSDVDNVLNKTHEMKSSISCLQVVRINRLLYHNSRIQGSANTPYEELSLRFNVSCLDTSIMSHLLRYNHKNYKSVASIFGMASPGDKSSTEEYMRASIPYITNIFDENKTDPNIITVWANINNTNRHIEYYRLGHEILSYYTDIELLKLYPGIKYSTRYELTTHIVQKLTHI